MAIESLLQQYRLLGFSGAAEELPGVLNTPDDPLLGTSYTEIYLGVWESPHGQRIAVAVKKFKPLTARSMHSDLQTLRRRLDKVGTSELLYKLLSQVFLHSASHEK